MSIAREGWPYIATLLGLGGALAFWVPSLGAVVFALGLFSAFFFRDPERSIPQDPRLVLSPADGRIVRVAPAPADNPLGAGAFQVSIFLSVFDVHVNRSPISGRIEEVEYRKGAFLPAFDEKASLRNEQNSVTVAGKEVKIVFRQIAGLIARRIVFRKRAGDPVERGERVGMIKFGSRVDVLLPDGVAPRVGRGDRVRGGTSVIGELP
jgi:phosphatidylserine decarboxylase